MSDKEKDLVEYLKGLDLGCIFYNNPPHNNNLSIGGGIQELLNIIEKQSKEIENLKDKESDYMTVYMTGVYDERSKWKPKIKDKIEELKQKYDRNTILQLTDYNEWIRYTAKVCVLNELLESEE